MACMTASSRGRKTLLIEHTPKIGEKIRISGGGRCNFTNLYAGPANYISNNPHFCKSALAGYTQHDFIKLVENHKIAYHEKTLGQLFCDGSSSQIIDMLVGNCLKNMAEIKTELSVINISKDSSFKVQTIDTIYECDSLVIATGGLSIPKIGATDFGYKIAEQFGHKIIDTRPALVPLLLDGIEKEKFCSLSGISCFTITGFKKTKFQENILFTHKGLSGPAILQISSYLQNFDEIININLLPNKDLKTEFLNLKTSKQTLNSFLKPFFASRLFEKLLENYPLDKSFAELKNEILIEIANKINNAKFQISGSEGYLKAEVTAGGVNTNEISSKTMESKLVPNLYFVGEVLDVTGWLGGYNFQWAWASGFAAGSYC